MNITYEFHENIAVIRFGEKELTASCEESFRNVLNILAFKRTKHFILDFTPVEFMNSFFLALLMEMYKSSMDQDGAIVAVNLCQPLKKIFHVIHMDDIIPIHASVNDGLEAIRKDEKHDFNRH